MSFETALRLTELGLAIAFVMQALEHLYLRVAPSSVYVIRLAASLCLCFGWYPAVMLMVLCLTSLRLLHKFQGPYNGGSDKMGLLILWCLAGVHLLPAGHGPWREAVFGYLGVQLVLSYWVSGWVKLRNMEWRSGAALRDVFAFSAYPVSRDLRRFAEYPRLLRAMSWGVIGFELAFCLALIAQPVLVLCLVIAALFHLANAALFGLNRFFWVWLACYPSLIWLQGRIVPPL